MLWITFEVIGTIAFAISGALVGITRKMDVFGVVVIAVVTATGGGIIRDVLVGRIPPNSLQTNLYIGLTIATTLVVFALYKFGRAHHFKVKWAQQLYLFADALGLASFTVTGASIGLMTQHNNVLLCVVLALLTAIGGGMVRDLLAHRTPFVLRQDVYALPAMIGAVLYYFIAKDDHIYIASYVVFSFVLIIRLLAIRFNWNLPKAY